MPTTNPVPSQDPSDLLFNAGKLDEVLNGTGNSFTDRLGVARRTVAGMNSDFDAQLADAESDLNVYRADASASAAQALGYLNTIRTTSYGAYAGDPATDPLGNPPNVGDEYFNTTSNLLKRFNGTTWQSSDINTANLAAPSGSSLLGYDTGTVQDVLDGAKSLQDYAALRAYTGRAKRIYITGLLATTKPAGIAGVFQYDSTDTTSSDNGGTIIVGSDGRRWKRDFDGYVSLSWFRVLCDGSDETSKIQSAIDACPVGCKILFDAIGVATVDPKKAKYVLAPNGGKNYAALWVEKPISIEFGKSFSLKIKEFCTAWSSMALGDSINAITITSSFVTIKYHNIDCNGRNHYIIEPSGFKWWETGPSDAPTVKRPPNGIYVIPLTPDSQPVKKVLISDGLIFDALAGVTFCGNVTPAKQLSFQNRTLKTGIVLDCVSLRNEISFNRGNGIIFVSGAVDCKSIDDVIKNGMYHAARWYQNAIDCTAIRLRSYVDCSEVIAKWNETDLGYWRTNDTSSSWYRMTRCGITFGSAWNYDSTNGHNVLNPKVIDSECVMLPLTPSVQAQYYNEDDLYTSGISTMRPSPGMMIRGFYTEGHYYGGFFTGGEILDETKRGDLQIIGFESNKCRFRGIVFEAVKDISLNGSTFVNGSGIDALVKNASNVKLTALTYINSTSATIGLLVSGYCPWLLVGDYTFSPTYTYKLYSVDAIDVPPLKGESIVINGFVNGWSAANAGGTSGKENICYGLSDRRVSIVIRLNGVSSTALTAVTLPARIKPIHLTSFTATDIVSNKTYFGRILVDGSLQIFLTGAPTDAQNLYCTVEYDC